MSVALPATNAAAHPEAGAAPFGVVLGAFVFIKAARDVCRPSRLLGNRGRLLSTKMASPNPEVGLARLCGILAYPHHRQTPHGLAGIFV